MTCKTCKYYDQLFKEVEEGKCKRYPPLMVNTKDQSFYSQPVVADDDTCGEHKELVV